MALTYSVKENIKTMQKFLAMQWEVQINLFVFNMTDKHLNLETKHINLDTSVGKLMKQGINNANQPFTITQTGCIKKKQGKRTIIVRLICEQCISEGKGGNGRGQPTLTQRLYGRMHLLAHL